MKPVQITVSHIGCDLISLQSNKNMFIVEWFMLNAYDYLFKFRKCKGYEE